MPLKTTSLKRRIEILEGMAGMSKKVTLERLVAASFGLVTLKDVDLNDPLCRSVCATGGIQWEGF